VELNVVDVKSGGQHQHIRLTVQDQSLGRIVGQFQAGFDQPVQEQSGRFLRQRVSMQLTFRIFGKNRIESQKVVERRLRLGFSIQLT
jgi:hypothetical protein